MTTSTGFCANCGAARPVDATFCPSCGRPYEAAGGSIQSNVAGGMLQLEQLRVKLIPFRIAGLVAAALLWWFVVGPLFGDQPLIVLGALAVLLGGGLWLGNVVGLALRSGRR